MKDPRIVFDARPVARAPITGVGRAFLNALAAYRRDPAGRFAVLWPAAATPPPELADCELVPAPQGALATQAALPALLRRLGAGILHSPVAAVPLRASCTVVSTVHDLPWMAAGGAPDEGGLRRRLATRLSVRRADAVLVPSRATGHDLARWAGLSVAGRTRVVPHGVAPPPGMTDAEPSGPFLSLGDARPRKNRAAVAAAHSRARQRCPDLPDLTFLGPPDRYVGEPEKWRRLLGSRALLHCSLWEGFGLPVLEAMACGVPVLCSAVASLPEVAGHAALLVDPRDQEAIALALVRMHRDEGLRAELRRRGLRRAAEFRPERPAAAWREVHTELLNRERER